MNSKAKVACMLLSACLLGAAFWCPAIFAWSVFFFLIPIFYCGMTAQSLRAWHGLVWGIAFFMLHGYGIVLLFYQKAQGPWRILVALALLSYCGSYAALWFWCAERWKKVMPTRYPWRACGWVITTCAYFIWMEQGVFWISGVWMGYCFASPLVSLAEYPQALATIHWLTPYGLLICLTSGSMACVLAVQQKAGWLLVAIACWAPFMYGFFKPASMACLPAYLHGVYYACPPPLAVRSHPRDCAQVLNEIIDGVVAQHNDVRCIIMPESTYPFALHENDVLIDVLRSNALPHDVAFVLGAHSNQAGKHFNSVFSVHKKQVIHLYDKSILMPLTEWLPDWCSTTSLLKALFLKKSKEFTSKRYSCLHPLPIAHFWCLPRICAELYFDAAFVPRYGVPVVCFVNESWFSALYLRNLMMLFARYKALVWHHDVMYVGHYQGLWISPHGQIVNF
jgi:hypothetical protein